MASSSLTKEYNKLPKIARILLQLFLGYIISGVYRVIKYTETKNIVTLVVGIVAFFTGVGNFVFWLVDLVTVILNDGYTVLAD